MQITTNSNVHFVVEASPQPTPTTSSAGPRRARTPTRAPPRRHTTTPAWWHARPTPPARRWRHRTISSARRGGTTRSIPRTTWSTPTTPPDKCHTFKTVAASSLFPTTNWAMCRKMFVPLQCLSLITPTPSPWTTDKTQRIVYDIPND